MKHADACIVLIGLLLPASAWAGCDIPEARSESREYTAAVCEGIGLEAEGKFSKAAESFIAASNIDFTDTPNYRLFARIALALHKAGADTRAKENLQKAELALSVSIGRLRCQESSDGQYRLVDPVGGKPVVSPYAREIGDRMCGAAYDGFYEYRSFDTVLADAQLIQFYLDARREIEGP